MAEGKQHALAVGVTKMSTVKMCVAYYFYIFIYILIENYIYFIQK